MQEILINFQLFHHQIVFYEVLDRFTCFKFHNSIIITVND